MSDDRTPAEIAAEVGIGLAIRAQGFMYALVGLAPPSSNDRQYAAFKRTEAKLIVAIDKWARYLGRPGGFEECGQCRRCTTWGVCPNCQPAEFARLP